MSIESPIMFWNTLFEQAGQGKKSSCVMQSILLVLQLFFVACRCFGGCYGHCKQTDEVQSGLVRPTNAQVAVGERLHLDRLLTFERELHFRLIWDAFCIARSESERTITKGFAKQPCILHHQCSNCHVQDLTLFQTTKTTAVAAPPPPYGEDGSRPRRACCNMSMCIHNCSLAVNNFCSTLHLSPKHTEQKQRRHPKITAIVSFLVLTAFFSQYVCFVSRKILTQLWLYLSSHIERLYKFFARCDTWSQLLCDQST